MFKQLKQYWYLFIIFCFFLINCSTITEHVDTERPEWIYSSSEHNKTTDEINFVGISYPTENLEDARYDALLNAGRTVISYLFNIKANREILLRGGVCVEFQEMNQIYIESSVHGALQVMSKIILNEVYVEKESEKSKNLVVFVNVSVKKSGLNTLRLSMAEKSARSIEGIIEESEFLAQQRKRAAEALRKSGVVELSKIKAGIAEDYVEWRKCKAILRERQEKKYSEQAKKQVEQAEKFIEEMSKEGFLD